MFLFELIRSKLKKMEVEKNGDKAARSGVEMKIQWNINIII